MKKITLKDVAKELNLSLSAVSAALNKRSNIPIATQEKVQKKAEEMGYSPDARITQLMSYLRNRKNSLNGPTLAWLYWEHQKGDYLTQPWLKGYLQGARKRAQELGYIIDAICINSPELPFHRLNSVLVARGIKGIILMNPSWPSPLDTKLDWSNFAMASLEGTAGGPGSPHVGSHGIKCIKTAFDNLLRLGYLRPGFVIGEWVNHANSCLWSAGFLQQQQRLPEADRIPILESDHWQALLPEWMKTHRPDVIICVANETIEKLNQIGFQVPADVAVLHLNVCSDVEGWAGIDELHGEIGSATVDVVTAQLNRGEKGFNTHAKFIYIPGDWVDGWTCPDRTR